MRCFGSPSPPFALFSISQVTGLSLAASTSCSARSFNTSKLRRPSKRLGVFRPYKETPFESLPRLQDLRKEAGSRQVVILFHVHLLTMFNSLTPLIEILTPPAFAETPTGPKVLSSRLCAYTRVSSLAPAAFVAPQKKMVEKEMREAQKNEVLLS